jgi:hypothetical protein
MQVASGLPTAVAAFAAPSSTARASSATFSPSWLTGAAPPSGPDPSRGVPAPLPTMPKLDPEYDDIPEDLPEDEDDEDHPSLTPAERNPNLK